MTKITHFRHATSLLEVDNKRILVDPVLAKKGTYPPIIHTKNPINNPLVELPTELKHIIDVDGIIITHDHNDHFDKVAKKILDREIPILCQNEDFPKFKKIGFTNLTSIAHETDWLGIKINRFIGTHGGHIFHSMLGVSSSYLLTFEKSKIYLSGDTLLTFKVRRHLKKLKPDFIIANGGGARMKLLGKITMNNRDIIDLARLNRNTKVIAVHMDSINHCFDTRSQLIKKNKMNNLMVPMDGEELTFNNA